MAASKANRWSFLSMRQRRCAAFFLAMLPRTAILEYGNALTATDVIGDALLVEMKKPEAGGHFESVNVVPIDPLHSLNSASRST
jgi:hypothetical protein